ncbi:MAG TPA: hypothetical protein VEZ55_10315 [Chitinophagaceae bacterium]|nr:hypothetical protein [Chitinophagaceae bacterium]
MYLVKRTALLIILLAATSQLFAQREISRKEKKEERREEKRQRANSIIKQEEEGVLVYQKQTSFGVQLRTNGYGAFIEKGKMISPRYTNLYSFEISEIFHPKEEKIPSNNQNYFGGSYKYGKINNFFQAKFGFGQQYIFGQKGNKNGVAVLGIYQGGLALGLLKPYYLDVDDNNMQRTIKYSEQDSDAFLNSVVIGSAGPGKGWSEVKIRPGAFVKTALRFDFDNYNESIKALEVGISVDAYAQKIQQMVFAKQNQIFFQGHIAIVFGGRK